MLPEGRIAELLRRLDRLAEERADDVDHRVVGALAGLRIALRRVADDAERRFVGHDLDGLDRVRVREDAGILLDQGEKALERAGRLVLVEAELEVHAHDGEVTSRVAEDKVEWAVARGLLELAEHAFGVAEDVARSEEAAHRTLHREDRDLGRDRGGRALRVAELLAGPDRPPRDVVGDGHADRRLDLLGGRAEHGAVDGGAGDGAMDDVIDLVGLEAEDLGEAAADLVDGDHPAEGEGAITASELGGGDRNWIEVVVPELACGVAELRVVAEVGPVGVPLAHRAGVGDDGLLGSDLVGRAEDRHAVGLRILRGLGPKKRRGVGLEGNRAEPAEDAVGVEHHRSVEHRLIRLPKLAGHEVDGELADAEGLIGVAGKRHGGRGRCGNRGGSSHVRFLWAADCTGEGTADARRDHRRGAGNSAPPAAPR